MGTWLFIPSWLIIYVFWIWPVRPKKYISDDSLIRKEIKRKEFIERRNKILSKFCCYCYCFTTNEQEQDQYNALHHEQQEEIMRAHRDSMNNHYDSDNRIVT